MEHGERMAGDGTGDGAGGEPVWGVLQTGEAEHGGPVEGSTLGGTVVPEGDGWLV